MLRLVTGVPGCGKTARIVDLLMHNKDYQGRPIYHHAIDGLRLGMPVYCRHPACRVCSKIDPNDETLDMRTWWEWAEADAVIVIDEAHYVFPQRQKDSTPEAVSRLTEHRHLGIDFILATQYPAFLDVNVRRLIGEHNHIRVAPFGIRVIQTSPEVSSIEDTTSTRSIYRLPKRVFDQYQSAEKHTKIRSKIPNVFYLLLILPLLGYGIFHYGIMGSATQMKSDVSSGGQTSSALSLQEIPNPAPTPSSPPRLGAQRPAAGSEYPQCISKPADLACNCYSSETGHRLPVDYRECLSRSRGTWLGSD